MCINAYIWNLENGINEPICRAAIEVLTQRMACGHRVGRRVGQVALICTLIGWYIDMLQESSIDIYALPCVYSAYIKQIASGKLYYSIGSSAKYSVMT